MAFDGAYVWQGSTSDKKYLTWTFTLPKGMNNKMDQSKSGDVIYFSGDNTLTASRFNPIIDWKWYEDGQLMVQGPYEDFYGQALEVIQKVCL